ncbi:M23 family metallopeptidase [Stenotrophomonas sp. SAM-B]|uniref:M23 family metallopeptidase n=1 Tax=Stenotrophomonas sp. SAM-B TaxID=2729141 RepID=UPI0015A3A492|nr:M23 family metallopeptidase [Stenotrophomonas sp. SAM-B]NWF32933.1 M23 family metallopeptidase [Stenotrophomonas sp. SAM-B]
MKTFRLLAVGLVIGVVGYWLLGPGPSSRLGAAEPAKVGSATSSARAALDAPPPPTPATTPVSADTSATPPAPDAGGSTPAPTSGAAGALLLPVQGVGADQLQDTFTDARSEGRVHDAIDILAPNGTPVLAVADGTVEKLFDSVRGGLTVYQFEPSGRYCYYYAHLDRYADGLAERKTIKRGEVIGYVGSTGNASPEAPHLHFEIHVLGPEKQWWKGESINPYPVLKGQQAL